MFGYMAYPYPLGHTKYPNCYSDGVIDSESKKEVRETGKGKLNMANIKKEKGINPKDKIGAKKPRLSYIPPSSLPHLAAAMENGANKYGAYNWRDEKIQAMIYADAALRHIESWIDGEDLAKDSLVHHLGHMMACGAILLDAIETNNLIDDRPTKGKVSNVIERMTKK